MELDVTSDAATQKTGIGSYFVANYPPFSQWTPQHVPDARAALARPAADDSPLGLYLHIPFCRKRCKFCYFRVYTDKNADEVQAYIDALSREVELYADQPALAGRQFEFVYFGGGTPSYISPKQLVRLIENISRYWSWDRAREVTFECEPGTLHGHKLQAIKDIGVTRLSLGIEHFDDEVLEHNGRAHKSPEIFRAYEWARQVGFDQINVDLIAGLVGETDEKWTDTVEKCLALDPDSVTIYQMELPFNAVFSREAAAAGSAPPVADWATKRRWVDEAFRRFEAAGYLVSSGYTLVKPSRNGQFVYRDSLWHGADMIGTGVASFSHLCGVHYQNHDGWTDYLDALQRGDLPLARALPLTARQLMIRELVLQLKTGRVDTAYFRDKFGVDIRDHYRAECSALAEEGYLDVVDDELRLTRSGLLRVDSLLPRFFEPEFRSVRYT
jgi:oxygen-independent coproporphyrinogen-3 oxidase